MPERGYCIGFLGADWWGSDPRAMSVEFRLRGHLLIERHYEDYMSTKWQSLPLRTVRRLALPWIKREYNRAVTEILSVRAVDFLLVFKGMLLEAGTLADFRSRNIPCYLLYPDVSFKAHGRNIWECLPLYDCVFTTKSFHLEDNEIRGRAKSMQLVNHGFDPAVHRPIVPSAALIAAYGCDVSFVGCWSKKKERTVRRIIKAMPDIDLRLWGPHWDQADPLVRKKWAGRGAYGDELAATYSFSKINLGLLSEAGTGTLAGDKVTARTWQIPASGGFLLHEDNAEIRRYFEPGREVELFGNERELLSKIKDYLYDNARREQIRQAGQQRCTSASYTYASAVDTVLKYHANNTGE
jgi:spore maturation protein CgeB